MTGKHAYLSDCGLYRYTLTRIWDRLKPVLVFVMLNPSTADADVDDPTIKKIVRIATNLGYGGVGVVNLFAFRATKPAALVHARDGMALDISGPMNDHSIAAMVSGKDVIVAWGANALAKPRADEVLFLVRKTARSIKCLGLTKDGYPRHPLYVLDASLPVAFEVK